MIAERREIEEAKPKDTIVKTVDQKMLNYATEKFSADNINSDDDFSKYQRLLAEVGSDWCLKRKFDIDDNELMHKAKVALEKFINKWKGRVPDASAKLGKINR